VGSEGEREEGEILPSGDEPFFTRCSFAALGAQERQSHRAWVRDGTDFTADLQAKRMGTFDLVIDGLCLHCLTQKKDRRAYLDSVRRLLKKDGVFILPTMCGPADRKRFLEACPGQKIVKNVVYVILSILFLFFLHEFHATIFVSA